MRHSGATLVEFLLALPSVHVDDKLASTTVSLEAFFECLLGIMTSHSKVDRVSIPSLECFDVILGAGIFSKLLDEASENNRGNDWIKNVLVRLAKWIKQELLKSKDVRKLHLGINV